MFLAKSAVKNPNVFSPHFDPSQKKPDPHDGASVLGCAYQLKVRAKNHVFF